MKRIPWIPAILLSLSACRTASDELTYPDLVRRLVDLEAQALLPEPGDRNAMWSSYSRASAYDAATGKYVEWGMNADGGNVIREEGGASVLAEMEGPGVIWRIWSAAPDKGHVKIFLDGAADPAIDMPFADFFTGKSAPFDYPSLCYKVTPVERKGGLQGGGCNAFVPIPYAKSCKVLAEKGWGNFYQITYASLPEGTRVSSFTGKHADADRKALQRVDQFLATQMGDDPAGALGPGRSGAETARAKVEVAAGQPIAIAELSGPRAITTLRVRPGFSAESSPEALRSLALRITWDGEPRPAVWSPLGDFFGSCPGINEFRTLPVGMTADGFYAHWFMPFAKNARVEIVNSGDTPYALETEVTHAPLTRPAKAYGRFHAKWHRGPFAPPEPERWMDWPLLKTEGRGRFLGVMLHVWNPLGGWWGEGDEKFYVDGEKFPSTFGTGSEDYFGYAWCRPDLFQQAFHAQTHNPGGNRGNVSVCRWQIADSVPFRHSFFATIEKYFPQAKLGEEWTTARQESCHYAALACWYLAPGGDDPYPELPLKARTDYYEATVPEDPAERKIPGAIEGEAMTVKERTGGTSVTQRMRYPGGTWSGGAQLWWRDAKPGDRLVLNLPVAKEGTFEIRAQLTKAKDYGSVQLRLDGKDLGAPIDCYHPEVIGTGEISLGHQTLPAGTHELSAEITGANPKAIRRHMFGIDYVLLRPAAR